MLNNISLNKITYKNKQKYLHIITKNSLGKNNTGQLTLQRPRISNKFNSISIDFWFAFFGSITHTAILLDIYTLKKYKNKPVGFLLYLDGKFKGTCRYFPLSSNTHKGLVISFNLQLPLLNGSVYRLETLTIGSLAHHVEISPNKGAVLARGIGTFIQILGQKKNKTIIKLPSGEIRLVSSFCFCIYGSNIGYKKQYNNLKYKAGDLQYKGRSPKVRGVAKNAIDHPHGGGEGKSRIGRKFLCTFKGFNFKGVKTRKKYSLKNKLIIKRKKIK